MRLIQFRFSHNCIKVRRALELKGLAHDKRDLSPLNRDEVTAASGQTWVPVLVDGDPALPRADLHRKIPAPRRLMRANDRSFELLNRKEVTESEAWGYLAVHGTHVFVRDLESVRAFP